MVGSCSVRALGSLASAGGTENGIAREGPAGRTDPAGTTDKCPQRHGRGLGVPSPCLSRGRSQGVLRLSGANPQQAGPLGTAHRDLGLCQSEGVV